MIEKEQFCPFIEICNRYDSNCSQFYNKKWFSCLNYQKIKDLIFRFANNVE